MSNLREETWHKGRGLRPYLDVRDDPAADVWRQELERRCEVTESGCWAWPHVFHYGYARTTFGRCYEQLAHRLSYRLFVGHP